MKTSVLLVSLSTITSFGLLAPSVQAALVTTYYPVYFPIQILGFSSPNSSLATANPTTPTTSLPTGASATFGDNIIATGTTVTQIPSALGFSARDIVSVVVSGNYSYNSNTFFGIGSLSTRVLSGILPPGLQVQTLASGNGNFSNQPFTFDITSTVLANFNNAISLNFNQFGGNPLAAFSTTSSLTSIRLAFTTIVPEPSALFGLLSLGALGLASLKRKEKV